MLEEANFHVSERPAGGGRAISRGEGRRTRTDTMPRPTIKLDIVEKWYAARVKVQIRTSEATDWAAAKNSSAKRCAGSRSGIYDTGWRLGIG
jgi:hypothetical protein